MFHSWREFVTIRYLSPSKFRAGFDRRVLERQEEEDREREERLRDKKSRRVLVSIPHLCIFLQVLLRKQSDVMNDTDLIIPK